MAIRHQGLQQKIDGDSGGREDQQTALRASGRDSSASLAKWTCKNSARRAQSLLGTLLTVFLEQLCRTDARCSWQLKLALELAIVSSITAW